jgi:hypothetical protein
MLFRSVEAGGRESCLLLNVGNAETLVLTRGSGDGRHTPCGCQLVALPATIIVEILLIVDRPKPATLVISYASVNDSKAIEIIVDPRLVFSST